MIAKLLHKKNEFESDKFFFLQQCNLEREIFYKKKKKIPEKFKIYIRKVLMRYNFIFRCDPQKKGLF